MTRSTQQIIANAQQAGGEFLITDLDVALTFLDVASVTNSQETQRRNLEHAREAYDTVIHLLPRIAVPENDRPVLLAKLAELKGRLVALGYVLDSGPEDPSQT